MEILNTGVTPLFVFSPFLILALVILFSGK